MADKAPTQPESAPSTEPVEPSADIAAIAQRMSRMQNKLLMDMSALMAETTALKQALSSIGQQVLPEGFEKLHTTFAMLARNIATSQVKVDDGHLETRRLFMDQFDNLVQRMNGQMLASVVEHFVLDALAAVIDDTDAVLGAATDDDRSLPAYDALRMVRNKLLAHVGQFGVQLLPVQPGESMFDEQLHECASVSADSDAPEGTIIDLDKHGFIVNGRLVRRATVVVKGAR